MKANDYVSSTKIFFTLFDKLVIYSFSIVNLSLSKFKLSSEFPMMKLIYF
jgi:hypothetical protein